MNLVPNINESEVQTVEHPVDQHGRMIYEDGIDFKCDHSDLQMLHKVVKDMLDANLVPMPEVDPTVTLLEMLAERESESYHKGFIFLPVNYFAGLWHCCNTARKFDVYGKKKELSNRLDQITMFLATQLDEYHRIKNPEDYSKNKERMKSLDSFKEVVKEIKQIINNSPQT